MKRIYSYTQLSLFLILLSCGSDDSDPAPANLSFSSPLQTLNESAGQVALSISLDAPLESTAEVSFSTSGTAVLNGDYQVISQSPITIAPGQTQASIVIEIIDDAVLENYQVEGQDISLREDKTLEVSLTDLSSNLMITESNTVALTIGDNETSPNSGLQADLMWDLGPGTPMDQVNLDLYAITDVIIDLGSITNFSYYGEGSRNETGFESTSVESGAPDKDYYLVVDYQSGEQDVPFEIFVYLPEGIVYAQETLRAAEAGTSIVFGPFSKSGSSFSASRNSQDFRGIRQPNLPLN